MQHLFLFQKERGQEVVKSFDKMNQAFNNKGENI